MTKLFTTLLITCVSAHANLYFISEDNEEPLPISWGVGMNLVWDDNTTPTAGNSDDTISLNGYVTMAYGVITPQTTWDIYTRLGIITYIDEPVAAGADDINYQTSIGFNLTHRFDPRLRFTSRNSLAYEMEPDYTSGFATNRQIGEYFYWNTDNSIGYRWSERLATTSGFNLSGLFYDNLLDSDRLTWLLYNQFRYQLSPQTVLTSTYRYGWTDASDAASDSTNQYLLFGLEHRYSPNTILVLNAGAQFRSVDGANGSDNTSPYFEATMRSNINEQFSVRVFARYGMEIYDTVQNIGVPVEFDSRLTLRVGTSATYKISPKLTLDSGVYLINASFEDGRTIAGGIPVGNREEFLANFDIGASLMITDNISGRISFNHTISDSDFILRDYDRNRVSIGINAQF